MTVPERFAIRYSLDQPLCGRCGQEEVGAVHIQVDDTPACVDCWEACGFLDVDYLVVVGRLVGALDAIDSALYGMPEHDKAPMLGVAIDAVFDIAGERVPGGREDPLPDRVFVDELIRRRPPSISQEHLLELVTKMAPNLTAEDLEAGQREAHARFTRTIGDQTIAEASLLVLARAGGGPGSEVTLGEAVDKLGIDFDVFLGGLTTACAELGVGPRILPPDVVNDLIAGSKVSSDGRPA